MNAIHEIMSRIVMALLTIKTIRFKTYESNNENLTYVNTNKGRKFASFTTYICQLYSMSSDQLTLWWLWSPTKPPLCLNLLLMANSVDRTSIKWSQRHKVCRKIRPWGECINSPIDFQQSESDFHRLSKINFIKL